MDCSRDVIHQIVQKVRELCPYRRDIPMPLVSSGVENGNLRELALERMKDLGTSCRDVRTREVGIQEIHKKVLPYEVRISLLLCCKLLCDYFLLPIIQDFLSLYS